MTMRNLDESFGDYKKRRAAENAALRQRMRGMPFFVSKSLPFKNKDGEKMFSTGTYIKGQDKPNNIKVYKVK